MVPDLKSPEQLGEVGAQQAEVVAAIFQLVDAYLLCRQRVRRAQCEMRRCSTPRERHRE